MNIFDTIIMIVVFARVHVVTQNAIINVNIRDFFVKLNIKKIKIL